MSDEQIKIQLSSAEALVLFEFVSRFTNHGQLEIADQAEERVLWDVCSSLESQLAAPLDSNYQALLSNARSKVRDHNL